MTTTTVKIENLCTKRPVRSISVESGKRVCVNCAYYEQYYRANRGNVRGWVPTSTGYCLRLECGRGPLRQPCKEFERSNNQ